MYVVTFHSQTDVEFSARGEVKLDKKYQTADWRERPLPQVPPDSAPGLLTYSSHSGA